MIKSRMLLLIPFLYLSSPANGQYYFYNENYYNARLLIEVGLSFSAFNCLTDLGGQPGLGKSFIKDLNPPQTRPGFGVFTGFLVDQRFGVRAELTRASVAGSDQELKQDQSEARNRFNRNLHFRSRIIEFALLCEAYPLQLLFDNGHPLVSPFLIIGIGLFRFNPRALLNGNWVALQPLRTEGQGFKTGNSLPVYNLTQLNFPLGLGIRYEVSALVNLRFEIMYRILRTDYLDDVSTRYTDPQTFVAYLKGADLRNAIALADRTNEIVPGLYHQPGSIRGNPKNKDCYFSLNLKVGYTLNRKHR